MKNSLVKCILLFSSFLSHLSCNQILAVKTNRILSHLKRKSAHYGAKPVSSFDCKLKLKRRKPKAYLLNSKMKRRQNRRAGEFISRYWPYGLPILGVPPLAYLTYKLIDRSDTQSSVPGCLLSRNEFTPKQEGAWWCWLACLCGLLKAQNVRTPEGNEITQEWMYEKIFKKKPAKFYHSREQGTDSVYFDSLRLIDFINSLSVSRYKFGVVRCSVFPENPEITVSNVEKIILDFYEKTGKRPFMTDLDKPILSSIGHVVNISKIYSKQDEKWLVYEDPLSGTQSERKLKDWCENCVKFHAESRVGKTGYGASVSLTMFSIAKPECELYDYTIFSAEDQNNKENVEIEEWDCYVTNW